MVNRLAAIVTVINCCYYTLLFLLASFLFSILSHMSRIWSYEEVSTLFTDMCLAEFKRCSTEQILNKSCLVQSMRRVS